MPYQVISLCENTYSFDEGGVRSFLVIGTERALLIDTGFGGIDFPKEISSICPHLPLTVLNTHADPDHIGGNHTISEPIFMHPADMPFAGDGHAYLPVSDGQLFDLGDRMLKAICVPGHTPGSVCLVEEDRRILYAGDTVSLQPISMSGETRNLEAYARSLTALSKWADRIDAIYPSHGPCPIADLISLTQALCEAVNSRLAGNEPDEKKRIDWPGHSFEALIYGTGIGRIMMQ